jgi:hypothetical protein
MYWCRPISQHHRPIYLHMVKFLNEAILKW